MSDPTKRDDLRNENIVSEIFGTPFYISESLVQTKTKEALDTKDLAIAEAQKRIAEQDSEIKVLREALCVVKDYYKKCDDSCLIELSDIADKVLTPQPTQDEKGEVV